MSPCCPTCRTPIDTHPPSRWRPFCSQRCQQLDLARWLDGDYRIASDERPATGDQQTDESGLIDR